MSPFPGPPYLDVHQLKPFIDALYKNSITCLGYSSRLKALANEDTLLRTHGCRHKCFPVCVVAGTNFVSGTQKMFLILFRNNLCPQQMFPSLRSPRNIISNNVVSATVCPRLPGPLTRGVNNSKQLLSISHIRLVCRVMILW